MALTPQVFDVDMGMGLDTFTDPKRLMPGKFTTLENARFQKGKRLEVRRGNVPYGGTYKLGNTGSGADSFGVFGNRLSVLRAKVLDDVPVFFGEYQDAAASNQMSGFRFASKFFDLPTASARLTIPTGTGNRSQASLPNVCQVQPHVRLAANTKTDIAYTDSCIVGSTVLTVWSEYDGTTWTYYLDARDTTGKRLFSTYSSLGSSTAGNGWCMIVPATSTKAWVFFPNNATTSVKIVIADVTSSGVGTSSANYACGSLTLDAVVLGSDMFVIGHNFDGGTGAVIKSGPTSWTTPGTFTAKNSYAITGTLQSVAFAYPRATATKLRAFFADSTPGLRAVSITASTGATVAGPTTLGAVSNSFKMAAVELGDEWLFVVHGNNDATYSDANYSNAIAVQEKGSFTGTTNLNSGGYLAGNICTRICRRDASDTASFWTVYFNNAKTESAYIQWQIHSGNYVALAGKQLGGVAVPAAQTIHGVAGLYPISSTVEQAVLLDSSRLLINSTTSITAIHGVSRLQIDYDQRRSLSSANVNAALVLGGGLVGLWDGEQLGHVGVLVRPSISTNTPNAAGGAMSNGTYSFRFVWEWTDSKGNIHQSAPSDPVTITLSGGGSAQRVALFTPSVIPFVGIVNNQTGSVFRPRLVLYSTVNGGTEYRRANDNPISPSGTPVSAERTCSDTDLLTRETLYTTGGVLPNNVPDGSPVIGIFNGRALLSSSSDDSFLFAQKPPVTGYGPEFSDELTLPISAVGGAVTAIVENVDKCVVFKRRSIQIFAGDGYAANGAGGYSPAETIYSHIGCPGPWAAVSTPLGVIFDTGGQGIWLLGRDLQLSFVGQGVDNWKSTEVYNVAVVPNEEEVRFLMASGEMLVYCWALDTWSVSTPFACWDLAIVSGTPIFLRQSTGNLGGVYIESETAFTDLMAGVIDTSAATITMQAILGWMNLAGLQGYTRVWRALFTGDYNAAHSLLIDAGYDYQSTYPDNFTLTSANILAGNNVYDGQVTLRQGYSKAVRLRLRVSTTAGATITPMSLTGLSFEVGLLPRAARMWSTKGA